MYLFMSARTCMCKCKHAHLGTPTPTHNFINTTKSTLCQVLDGFLACMPQP